MRFPCNKVALFVVIAVASGTAAAQASLSAGHGGGLGLKPLARADRFGNEAAPWRRPAQAASFELYGGAREAPLFGLRATESFAGISYSPRGRWASTLEAGYIPETAAAPRRYALTGRLQTSLSEGRTLSVGLRYLDTEAGLRNGMPPEIFGPHGYTLTGLQLARFGYAASSYQVHMSYQYSPAGTVGLALGRELETAAYLPDYSASGPRQLSFTGQHWLTPSWALSYDVSPDLATPLRVEGLRLGVRYRF